MRRADRLFSIVLELRRRPVTTAAQLGAHLEVSVRTVYRDIADLVAAGIPIEGETGVGYRLGSDFDLPPLMFTVPEVQAIVLGARMVEAWGDPRLRTAARNALRKIEAVLPPSERHRISDTALYALSFWTPDEPRETLGIVREAVDRRRRLAITYARDDGVTTERIIRPLGLFFWGRSWTVAAWCELRTDHRSFRVDRIADIRTLDDTFAHESPVTLDDFRAAIDAGSDDGTDGRGEVGGE